MATVKVWILVMYMTANAHGGPAVVDNIASQAECEKLRTAVLQLRHAEARSTVCLEVVKLAR